MKKFLVVLAIFAIAMMGVIAEGATIQQTDSVEATDCFHVDGIALSQQDLSTISGGQFADMDGSYRGYGQYDRVVERDSTTRPTLRQIKESAHDAVNIASEMPRDAVDVVIKVVAYGLHRWIDSW
jgi:hypothetical protein